MNNIDTLAAQIAALRTRHAALFAEAEAAQAEIDALKRQAADAVLALGTTVDAPQSGLRFQYVAQKPSVTWDDARLQGIADALVGTNPAVANAIYEARTEKPRPATVRMVEIKGGTA